MFDIAFSEILFIGIIALVVFGPEELPRVARTVGHLLGKLRRYVADVKSDISREMEASEMKTLVADVQESARSLQMSLNEQAQAFKAELSASTAAIEQDVRALDAADPLPHDAVPGAALLGGDLFTPAESTPVAASDEVQLDLFGQPIETPGTHKD